MAGRAIIIEHQRAALVRIAAVLEKHDCAVDDPVLIPNGIPNSARQLDETITFLAASGAALADLVDQQIEASKPRPRGRPRREDAA